jgi:hypothetical protein
VTTQNGKKLFFGSPNPLLLLEDLSYRLSLSELKAMFDNCVEYYRGRIEKDSIAVSAMPIDIHDNLRNMAMGMHKKELYDEQIKY